MLEIAGQSPSLKKGRDRPDTQCRGLADTEVSGHRLDSMMISEVFAHLIDSVVL